MLPARLGDRDRRRSIGEHVDKTYSVTGELLSPEAYKRHLSEVLPTADDEKILHEIISAKDWVTQIQMN